MSRGADRWVKENRTCSRSGRDFLVRVDSYTSLIAYRYPQGIEDDVLDELKRLSTEARLLYEPRPSTAAELRAEHGGEGD